MESLTDQIRKLMQDFSRRFTDWVAAVDWHDVVFAILLVLVVVAFRNVLAQWAVRASVSVGKALNIVVSETVETAILPAAKALIVSFVLLLAVDIIGFPGTVGNVLERILISIAIASIFSVAYVLTDPLTKLMEPYRRTGAEIQFDWLIRAIKIIIVFLGISAVLAVWDIDIGPVITGMGILGAGVALAAQDLFRNLIGGVTNMSEHRFGVGDWIRVEGVIEGVVERVEFRSTQIRRFDKALVHVPNGDLSNSPVINFSRMPHRRIYWKISLVYSTTAGQLAEIRDAIEGFIDGSGDFVAADRAPRYVRIDSFNESAIDLLVYCFTVSNQYAIYLEAKEKLLLEIQAIVERAGSSFAYPSRSIYIEAAPTAGPEAFVTNVGEPSSAT